MVAMKLIYRISITTFCIVLATALILSSYSSYVQKTLINSQLEKKGQVLADLLSASVKSHLLSYDYFTIKLLLDPLKQDNDIVSVALFGPDNYIKMHSDITMVGEQSGYTFSEEDFSDRNVISMVTMEAKQKQYLFFSSVVIDHIRAGVIQIVMSDKESLQLIALFGKQMWSLTVGVLLIGLLAGYLMSHQISTPLVELIGDINRFMMKRADFQFGQGRFNEITILKRRFQTMMSELQYSIDLRVKNEKMAILGNLSSVLAHEVKNPLEPIKGSVEILRTRYPENADITKYTGIIQSEVSELISFLDSFLDVAKTSTIAMRSVDVNKSIKDILTLLEYSLGKENMRTDLLLEENILPAKGNISMIKQIFLNLLINAMQAKKGEFGLVEISTTQEGEYVVIRIKDYGVGVEESKRNIIFQPFYTTKDEGSGIGLSTSRHLIQQHNGSITIDSDLDQWTEFTIKLPIWKGKTNE